MADKFYVDPDIKKASTLPASLYRDKEIFRSMGEKIFHRSWQYIDPAYLPRQHERAVAFRLLDGYLKVPLLLSRDQEDCLHCLSNVCTHRGNLLVRNRSRAKKLVCGYHGRRFAPDGSFEFMPEFMEAEDFPTACDNLPHFPLYSWGPMHFTSLNPAFEFNALIRIMEERVGFLPLKDFKIDPDRSRTYSVKAHWALYCDNYLEGFHIPFVHKDLDAVLDYGAYDTLLFDHGSLQIGYADAQAGSVFRLPGSHTDYGKKVAAYYFWIFPNLMFNFYPWGLSLNIVTPVGMEETRVQFVSYVYDSSQLQAGAGAGLDKVEMEDEAVVEGVQQGLQSGFYSGGRFSPTRETGVHHFHRLLAHYLNS